MHFCPGYFSTRLLSRGRPVAAVLLCGSDVLSVVGEREEVGDDRLLLAIDNIGRSYFKVCLPQLIQN
jgi:hypothetical protein